MKEEDESSPEASRSVLKFTSAVSIFSQPPLTAVVQLIEYTFRYLV